MKFTALGAATATATALTVGIPPDPDQREARKAALADVDLAAAINPWPRPNQIPDLTGGLGTAAYDTSQAIADLVIRAIVENVNLAALAQAAGLDLDTLLEGLLGGDLNDLLGGVLGGVLDGVPLDTGGLANALLGVLPLDPITAGVVQPLLATALGLVGADSVGGLLGLLGLDLSDPLNLANLALPGVNTITAGPAFTLLKLLGVDLGWVPSLPNSVANEINGTEYLEVGVQGLLQAVLDIAGGGQLGDILQPVVNALPPGLDVLDLRVPITIGIGLGAFAAAMAYDKVRADLGNQPGGELSTDNPLLGSLTVLPMLLLLNPARPNGGMFSRFYPLAGLFGIDTVNPVTEATSSCDGPICIPVLDTGLTLGGANLLPLLIDVGLGYFPANDLAAWPNPFSLANNAMALALPTYLLRGLDLSTVDEQLTTQLDDILAGVLDGEPLAINLYLTLMPNTLPLVEPLYLAADLLNLVTLGAAAPFNPFSLVANAFAPVLTSLVNLGYTDVEFDPVTGGYVRTLTEAGVPTPFFSFPNVNLGQVPGVLFNQLLQGIQKEFLSGNPTPGTPNAITGLLDLLGGGLLPLGDLGGLLQGILDGLNPLALTQEATTLAEANSVPSAQSRMVTLSTEAVEDETLTTTADSEAVTKEAPEAQELAEEEPAEEESAEEEPAEEDAVEEVAVDEDPVDEDPVDEDAADEDAVDEDAADQDQDQGTDDTPGTVSNVTKPGNFNAPASTLNGPRHAKPDNDSPDPDAGDTEAGNDSDSDGGASDNAAA